MDTAAVRAQAISALAPPFRSESILWLLVELDRVRGERDRAVNLLVAMSVARGCERDQSLASAMISLSRFGEPDGPTVSADVVAALAAHDRRSAG